MSGIIKSAIAGICSILILFGGGVIFGWGFYHGFRNAMQKPIKVKVEVVEKESADA